LQQRVSYLGIHDLVEKVCSEHQVLDNLNLGNILEADTWARRRTEELVAKFDARSSMHEPRD
jgi:1-deoxy-D-xylulose-5-phosphate reductoisomerase